MNDIRVNPIELERYSIDPDQQKQICEMAKCLQERGQLEPIYINENLTVIWDGHTRYLASKKLGRKSIKAIIMSSEEWSEHIKADGPV